MTSVACAQATVTVTAKDDSMRAPDTAAGQPGSSRPASATPALTAAVMVLTFVAAGVVVRGVPFLAADPVRAAAAVLALSALAVGIVDLGVHRVHLRPSTGLDFGRRSASLRRTAIKLAGLLATVAAIGALYALFPEYHGTFYEAYFALLRGLVPFALVAAVPYFYWLDSRMTEPADGYYAAGLAVLGRWRAVNRAVLLQHALGWLIKGFFLPLMFTYFSRDLGRLVLAPLPAFTSFGAVYNYGYDFLYYIDVGLVSLGYLASFRLTDTHLRSAEPTLAGWVAALVCYEPFWSLIGNRYLAYGSGLTWGVWLGARPVAYALWGSAILLLTAVYVWATVVFGARFSNLTHRGIITSGPYRFVKHPAYLAKNLSWWLISVPFLVQDSIGGAVRHSLLLLGVNLIYVARALTEERHLGQDPTYRAYAACLDRHGWLRVGGRSL